jgi:dolichol-phosphate mannosyltransferase
MTILPAMLQKLVEGSDLVIGSRYIPGGSTGHWSPIRRLESWIATKLAQWVSGVRICDPMSGYFMMQRSDFLRVRDALDVQGFKILLEIAAHQKPVKVSEVPFTFGVRVAGESKLTGKVVYQYLVQLWKLSPMGKMASPEFAKFAAVGASGVLVNLMAMALLLSFTPIRDWRASGLATLLATFSNYALNNFWTFHRRAHRGGKFVGRYAFYLAGSAIALGATTLTFSALSRLLSWTLKGAMPSLKTPLLLACQLVAILAGALLNYKASRTLTWPSADCLTGDIPEVQVSTNIHNEIRRENHEMDLTLVHSEYHGTVLASERQK